MMTAGAGVCSGRYRVASSVTGSSTPGPPGTVTCTSLLATGSGSESGHTTSAIAATSTTTTATAMILRGRVESSRCSRRLMPDRARCSGRGRGTRSPGDRSSHQRARASAAGRTLEVIPGGTRSSAGRADGGGDLWCWTAFLHRRTPHRRTLRGTTPHGGTQHRRTQPSDHPPVGLDRGDHRDRRDLRDQSGLRPAGACDHARRGRPVGRLLRRLGGALRHRRVDLRRVPVRRGVLRRLRHRIRVVHRQPVRLRRPAHRVPGAPRTAGPGGAHRHRDRARAARHPDCRRRGADRAVLLGLLPVRALPRAHRGAPRAGAARRAGAGPRAEDRRAAAPLPADLGATTRAPG